MIVWADREKRMITQEAADRVRRASIDGKPSTRCAESGGYLTGSWAFRVVTNIEYLQLWGNGNSEWHRVTVSGEPF